MNKKILVGSILAAVLVVLAMLTSVVGFQTANSSIEKKNVSPLFTIRKNRFLDREGTKEINSNYIGKDKVLNIFFSKKSSLQVWTDKAFKMIETRPQILRLIVNKMDAMPEIASILKDNDISMEEFKNQMNLVMNDPSMLKQKVDEAVLSSPFKNEPLPVGLSTSSALGCFIIVLILAPIMALVGAIIATITIITCLDIGGCFETLVQNLLDSFVQGLTPPGYGDYI